MKKGASIPCPCGAWSDVKATRQQSVGYVRLRVCANGHKFKTVETIIASAAPGGARTRRAANDDEANHAAQG